MITIPSLTATNNDQSAIYLNSVLLIITIKKSIFSIIIVRPCNISQKLAVYELAEWRMKMIRIRILWTLHRREWMQRWFNFDSHVFARMKCSSETQRECWFHNDFNFGFGFSTFSYLSAYLGLQCLRCNLLHIATILTCSAHSIKWERSEEKNRT